MRGGAASVQASAVLAADSGQPVADATYWVENATASVADATDNLADAAGCVENATACGETSTSYAECAADWVEKDFNASEISSGYVAKPDQSGGRSAHSKAGAVARPYGRGHYRALEALE